MLDCPRGLFIVADGVERGQHAQDDFFRMRRPDQGNDRLQILRRHGLLDHDRQALVADRMKSLGDVDNGDRMVQFLHRAFQHGFHRLRRHCQQQDVRIPDAGQIIGSLQLRRDSAFKKLGVMVIDVDVVHFIRIDAPDNDIFAVVAQYLRQSRAPAAASQDCSFHSLTFFLAIMRIGVPSSAKDARSWFSRNLWYVKCIRFGSLHERTNTGG